MFGACVLENRRMVDKFMSAHQPFAEKSSRQIQIFYFQNTVTLDEYCTTYLLPIADNQTPITELQDYTSTNDEHNHF